MHCKCWLFCGQKIWIPQHPPFFPTASSPRSYLSACLSVPPWPSGPPAIKGTKNNKRSVIFGINSHSIQALTILPPSTHTHPSTRFPEIPWLAGGHVYKTIYGRPRYRQDKRILWLLDQCLLSQKLGGHNQRGWKNLSPLHDTPTSATYYS